MALATDLPELEGLAEGRSCGDCRACCQAFPAYPSHGAEPTRCQWERRDGCGLWGEPALPPACKAFACAWLMGAFLEEARPDRAGVMVLASRSRTNGLAFTLHELELGAGDALAAELEAWPVSTVRPGQAKQSLAERLRPAVRS